MSLAKLNKIKKVRKATKCEKCGVEIKVGDPAVKFAVGFRGRTRVRCAKTECSPRLSERESSLVSSVYAAQEDADVDSAGNLEDLHQIRDDVAEATLEVASEYEMSEMYERNYDLQERAEMLNTAAGELEGWEPEDEEPTDLDEEWSIGGEDYTDFAEAHAVWLDAARESLQEAIDGMELP